MTKRALKPILKLIYFGMLAASVFIWLGHLNGLVWSFDLFANLYVPLSACVILALPVAVFLKKTKHFLWIAPGIVIALFVVVNTTLLEASDKEAEPLLRLYQHNVLYTNPGAEAAVEDILASGADIVTLQERGSVNDGTYEVLSEYYPYHASCVFGPLSSVEIWSKYPFTKDGPEGCVSRDKFLWQTIETEHGPLTVVTYHALYPIGSNQKKQVDRAMIVMKHKQMPQRFVFAGDLNATPWSRFASHIASELGGEIARGYRATWLPAIFPDWLRGTIGLPIDHVLHDQSLSAKIRMGNAHGSDHLPLIVDFGVRR